ncbi:uncharacterized protein LOC126799960 [Argentina anserina]|uniref:uncharacterized protein LOC126799960 n=1 Tax=Argentina anserina TaxID=57926 RepID=UPI0021768719|nr:uncharacterized protein LOC126799960 [Potentilla anserina]
MAKMKRQSEKMSLEDYLLLLQSRSHLHLTVAHLNQLISMHGYKKLHRVHKKVMSDAVSTMDLVEPTRSTLGDYISPAANASLDDVVADLNVLSWKECAVTAIETVCSSQRNDAVAVAVDCCGASGAKFQGKAEAPVKKALQRRKKRTRQESGDAAGKRQRKSSQCDGDGGGGDALALVCVSSDSNR